MPQQTFFPFFGLPPEVQCEVLRFLPSFDIGSLNTVCKAARALASSAVSKLDMSITNRSSRDIKFPATPASHFTSVQHLSLNLLHKDHYLAEFLSQFIPRYAPVLLQLSVLSLSMRRMVFTPEDVTELSNLLQHCTKLKQLEVNVVISPGQHRGKVKLVLKEPVAGQGLQELESLVSSVAARADRVEPVLETAEPPTGTTSRVYSFADSTDSTADSCTLGESTTDACGLLESMLASQVCLHSLSRLCSDDKAFRLDAVFNSSLPPPGYPALRELVLEGSCGPTHPPSVSQLAALTRLKVTDTRHDAPWAKQIGGYTNLVDLEYESIYVDMPMLEDVPMHLPPDWSQLQSLRRLSFLRNFSLRPPCPLWQLTSLEHLRLWLDDAQAQESHNSADVSALTHLTSLHLTSGTPNHAWSDVFTAVSSTLIEMRLEWYRFQGVSADLPLSLTRLQSLKSLKLMCIGHVWGHDGKLAPSAITRVAALTSLEHLVIESEVERGAADQLSSLTLLTHLRIQQVGQDTFRGGTVSSQSPLWAALGSAGRLKELKILLMLQWPVVIPPSITSLHISKSHVQGHLPMHLAACSDLQVLHYAAQSDDKAHRRSEREHVLSGIDVLAQLTGLRELKLRGVAWGTYVGCLDALTRLTAVAVSGAGGFHGECPRLMALGRLKEVSCGTKP